MSYSFGSNAATANKSQASAAHGADRRSEKDLLTDIQKSLAEADERSTATLGILNTQTEQLERIQGTNSHIDDGLGVSEWLIKGLQPWGWAKNWFSKGPDSNDNASVGAASASTVSGAASSLSDPRNQYESSRQSATEAQSRSAQRLLADEAARRGRASATAAPKGPVSSRMSETDQAYDGIEKMLGTLAEKSKEIGRTLNQHNEVLPEIARDVDRNHDRVRRQTDQITKLG